MGMGFRKGGKKTAKTIDNELTRFQQAVRQAILTLQFQLAQVNQRTQMAERMIELVDYRSLATLKVLLGKNAFTEAEHNSMAELQRILSFDQQSEADNAARGFTPAAESDVVDDGFVYVARVDAYEPLTIDAKAEDGTITVNPNPKANEKIEQLSMLRVKVAYGSGEFPKDIETKLKGLKAGESTTFVIECPKELVAYAGKKVCFKIDVLQLLKLPPKQEQPEEQEDDGDAVEVEEVDTPRLSVVEKPN